MKLLKVFPIVKGVNKDSLSYFTGADVSVGAIIKVPIRKKTVPALVVSVESVADVKAEIKDAPFEIKKIEKVKATNLFSKEFIASANEAAQYFATTTGNILSSVIPNAILESADKISLSTITPNQVRISEKLVIQSDDEERFATYKSLIREEFARGYSVFFCLPTIQDIKKAYEKLSKGIEQYTFVLHGLLSKKEQIELWQKASNENHAVLIIATGSFLGINRHDLGTIIVDKENSRAYKSQSRPFLDTRVFAEILAQKVKARLVYGDLLLRTETVFRHNNNELYEIAPLKFRSLTTSEQKIINMKEVVPQAPATMDKTPGKEPKFKLFSDELLEQIKRNQENDENMFIFVARRGLFPSTVCADCGTIVVCNSCGAPTVLHKAPTENFFLCHRCGEHRSAMEKCRECQSWRLTTFGIGIEGVEEELKKNFPELKIFRLDTDTANTHKKSLDIAAKFYSAPGSVLLGTEMALLYLKESIPNSAVLSMDSFFSIPDFRVNEKVMNILLKIRSFTSHNFLVQTRNISQPIFRFATSGNLADFYRDEIRDREQLNYPPFSLPVKITLTGDKRTVLAGMENLQKIMSPYEIDVFPAFIPGIKGKFSMHGLVKIKRSTWVDKDLLQKLRNLPPNYTVNVDPDSLL
jgi:primosomal protein N' (replication factor Y)